MFTNLRSAFNLCRRYTTDGGSKDTLEKGTIPEKDIFAGNYSDSVSCQISYDKSHIVCFWDSNDPVLMKA